LRRLASAALAALLALVSGRAAADDYVTVRGAYYREHSTRVIQPLVEVESDTPSGWDVKAHYLLDAITSASVAAGTATDSIFTETRNEAGAMVRRRWSRSDVVGSYRYSAESDYWAHTMGLGGSTRFWGDTARIGMSLGLSLDRVASRARTPACAVPPDPSCPLTTYYAGANYTQILSRVAIAQVSAEAALLDGFQGNLYRTVPNLAFEVVPSQRLRAAFAARANNYFERLSMSVRLHYRYYFDSWAWDSTGSDPWRIWSHTIEARLYKPLTHTLEARLTYRQYFQSRANFWCDVIASPGCYGVGSIYYSTDPKLGPVYTSYPEVQLVWHAEALAGIPVLGWASAGYFTLSYGRFIQSTTFGDAHVLQSGYTLPY
jgi:hypothetical protein